MHVRADPLTRQHPVLFTIESPSRCPAKWSASWFTTEGWPRQQGGQHNISLWLGGWPCQQAQHNHGLQPGSDPTWRSATNTDPRPRAGLPDHHPHQNSHTKIYQLLPLPTCSSDGKKPNSMKTIKKQFFQLLTAPQDLLKLGLRLQRILKTLHFDFRKGKEC